MGTTSFFAVPQYMPMAPLFPANRSITKVLPEPCREKSKAGLTRTNQADAARSKMAAQSNDLVLDHLPLVRAIAARCRVKLPAHLEVSDLFQAGVLGLLDAACKYDPETNAAFSTYATHRIR